MNMNSDTKKPGGMFDASGRAKVRTPEQGSSIVRNRACPRGKRKDGRKIHPRTVLSLRDPFLRAKACRPMLDHALDWTMERAATHTLSALGGLRKGEPGPIVCGAKADSATYALAFHILDEAQGSSRPAPTPDGQDTRTSRLAALSSYAGAVVLELAALEEEAKSDTRSRLHECRAAAAHMLLAKSCRFVAAELCAIAETLETPERLVEPRRQRLEAA